MKKWLGMGIACVVFGLLFLIVLFITYPTGPQLKRWTLISNFSEKEVDFPVSIEQRGPFVIRLTCTLEEFSQNLLVLTNVYASRIEVFFNGALTGSKGEAEDDSVFWGVIPISFPLPAVLRKQKNEIEIRVYSRESAILPRAPYLTDTQDYVYQSKLLTFITEDMFLIAVGMCFFLSFLLILMGKLLEDYKTTYIAIGMSAFFNGLSLIIYSLSPGSEFNWFEYIFYTFQPVYFVLCSYLICVGIESFLTKKTLWSKKILWTNVIGILVYILFSVLPIKNSLFRDIPYLAMITVDMVVLMIIVWKSDTGAKFMFPVTMLELSVAYEFFRGFSIAAVQVPFLGYGSLAVILGYGIIFVWEFQRTYQELQTTSSQLFASYEEMTAMNEELENSYHELDKKVEQRTHELKEAMDAIKLLMDNTDEGFLSFNTDMLVEKNYSSECDAIFGKSITTLPFDELLFPENAELREFIKNILPKILREKRSSTAEMYLSLLPDEVEMRQKMIRLEYKILDDPLKNTEKKMMVILRDITEKRILESKIEEERNILKMVIKVLLNREDFLETVLDFKQFIATDFFRESLTDIYRIVHTFKGTFANFEMTHTVNLLHEVETQLSDNKDILQRMDYQELSDYLNHFHLNTGLEEDYKVLKSHLDKDFFEKERQMTLDPERIRKIEAQILTQLPDVNHKALLLSLKKLRYVAFISLLNNYPDYVSRLAQRMGKWLNPVVIVGTEVLVDKDRFKDFSRSLVHLFRNAVDHGIEPVEERIEKGKQEYGNITITVTEEANHLVLQFKDDGSGLNMEKIKQKAIEKELVPLCNIEELEDQDFYHLIFDDGFSTTEEVTTLSGRGIGLSAVKRSVEELDGEIAVDSKRNEYTIFTIRIPLGEMASKEIPPARFMNPVLKNALQTLRYYGVEVGEQEYVFEQTNEVILSRFSSFIGINGLIRTTFLFSADQGLCEHLARKFSLTPIGAECCSIKDIEDATAEISNIILGNSIRSMGLPDSDLLIHPPFTMVSGALAPATAERSRMHYLDVSIWRCEIHTKAGNCMLFFIGNMQE